MTGRGELHKLAFTRASAGRPVGPARAGRLNYAHRGYRSGCGFAVKRDVQSKPNDRYVVIRKGDGVFDSNVASVTRWWWGAERSRWGKMSTTEGTHLTVMDMFRQASAEVAGVAVIVDRGAEKAVCATGLSYRSAYSLADVGQEV